MEEKPSLFFSASTKDLMIGAHWKVVKVQEVFVCNADTGLQKPDFRLEATDSRGRLCNFLGLAEALGWRLKSIVCSPCH